MLNILSCTQKLNRTGWSNLGVVWSEESGLYGVVDGVPVCVDQSPLSVSSPLGQGRARVGANSQHGVHRMDWEVGTVAMWTRELQFGHFGSLLGVTGK